MVNLEEKKQRLRSFLNYYLGEEEGKKRYRRHMSVTSLKTLIFKYGKEEGTRRYEQRIQRDKYKSTLPAYVERYGAEEGPRKYYEKNSKLSVGIEALRRSGKTEEEIIKIREIHKKKSEHSLENFIRVHGEKKGRERYEHHIKVGKISYRSKKQLMERRGLSEEQAAEIYKGVQRRNENFYIKKYGLEKGRKKFKEVNEKKAFANTQQYYVQKYGEKRGKELYKVVREKRVFALSREYYIEKYGAEEGTKIYYENKAKGRQGSGCRDSEIQLNFSLELYKCLPRHLQEIFEGQPIREDRVILLGETRGVKYCIPDITIGKILVEFDGEYWHSLPEVVDRDLYKVGRLVEMGYKVIRVKEREYRRRGLKVVEETVNEILKEIENENKKY